MVPATSHTTHELRGGVLEHDALDGGEGFVAESEFVTHDGTSNGVRPDGTGSGRRGSPSRRPQPWRAQHLDVSGCRGPQAGPRLLSEPGSSPRHAHRSQVRNDLDVDALQIPLIMDYVYEGNEARFIVQSLGSR